MPTERREFGDSAEKLAESHIKTKGYKILERQFRTRYGEIDLIAKQGDEIVFIEVKARRNLSAGYPEESVTPRKLRSIEAVANFYMQAKKITGDYRIDVIAIIIKDDEPEIRHIQNVF